MREQFVKFYYRDLMDAGLKTDEALFYSCLLDMNNNPGKRSNKDGWFQMTSRVYLEYVDYADATIKKYLNHLKELGYIDWMTNPNSKTSRGQETRWIKILKTIEDIVGEEIVSNTTDNTTCNTTDNSTCNSTDNTTYNATYKNLHVIQNQNYNQNQNKKDIEKGPVLESIPDSKKEDAKRIKQAFIDITGINVYSDIDIYKYAVPLWAREYSTDDIIDVVKYKGKEWINDSKMAQYIRPSTLFKPEKFSDYLAQSKIKNTTKSGITATFIAVDKKPIDRTAINRIAAV